MTRNVATPILPVFAAFSILCSGCATLDIGGEQKQESAVAVETEMAVKAALLEDEQVAAAPIRIQFERGAVRLVGFVETQEERQRVMEIAKQTLPDFEIINELEVWDASGKKAEGEMEARIDK